MIWHSIDTPRVPLIWTSAHLNLGIKEFSGCIVVPISLNIGPRFQAPFRMPLTHIMKLSTLQIAGMLCSAHVDIWKQINNEFSLKHCLSQAREAISLPCTSTDYDICVTTSKSVMKLKWHSMPVQMMFLQIKPVTVFDPATLPSPIIHGNAAQANGHSEWMSVQARLSKCLSGKKATEMKCAGKHL